MAGIGFELRKVAGRGTFGSFIQVALSGVMIVAGPWILSIITLTLINRFIVPQFPEGGEYFGAAVIYCYAVSLILGGGFHFIFSRIMSDFIYLKQLDRAFTSLIRFTLTAALTTVVIGVIACYRLSPPVPYPLLYHSGFCLLLTSISCIWIVLLFSSILKWYGRILMVFAAGLSISLIGVYFFSRNFSSSGALFGFALGHLILMFLLMILNYRAVRESQTTTETAPEPPELNDRPEQSGQPVAFFRSLLRFRFLFLTGSFFSLGIWIDKIVYWLRFGVSLDGTFFRLFESYDISIYISNLSMIPGLVFFTIVSETDFYMYLRRFLFSMGQERLGVIQINKRNMISNTYRNIREQSLFQGIISGILILFSAYIAEYILPVTTQTILVLTVAAVFFHLIVLTFMNYLFYIERYRATFFTAFLFCIINLSGALLFDQPGISYLAAAFTAALFAGLQLYIHLRKLERVLFLRADT